MNDQRHSGTAEHKTMGPVFLETWMRNTERICFATARYKFVKRLLDGKIVVAEIGAADGTLSKIVAPGRRLELFDLAPAAPDVMRHDIVRAPLPGYFSAIYTVDVLEHIAPADEPAAMRNICRSLLQRDGVFIAGVPSLQSQAFANEWSKVGHVNCRDGRVLREAMRQYFDNVFLFTMNDEQIGTGNGDLAYYLFVLCVGPK